MDCVHRYPDGFAAVVLADTKKSDALGIMEKCSEQGAIGIRLRTQERSPGADPLAMWRRCFELGWRVSGSSSKGLTSLTTPEFTKLVEELPDLKIVLEHMDVAGLPTGARVSPIREVDSGVFEKVLTSSKYPNIYLKLPGLGEFVANPNQPHFDSPVLPPLREVKMACDASGSHRMMWGSDFPRCSGRESHTNALKGQMEKIPFFSSEDKELVFGKTARSV
jgi:L-fuconolactonase